MEYAFGDFTLDLARGELRCGARPVALEPRAFALLAHMLEHQGRLVEKDELIASVWGGRIVSDAAISTAIKAVRRALGDDGSAPVWLKTVRGRGFRFDGAVERRDKAEEGREERSGGKALAPNSPPTIVVLPFSHSPDNDERRWLIDAISDDVLTGLSLFRDLRVISRLTSFGLGNLSSTALSQALAELGADYMVEGSLRKQGAVFRLSVALSDAKSGQQVWGGRWDLSREALQDLDQVVNRIVAAIQPELLAEERNRVRGSKSTDLTAWEITQRGLWLLWQQKSGAHEEAISILEEALILDPHYALAHAGLAYALCHAFKEGVVSETALEGALDHARAAVRLDPRDAFSYVALGRSHLARREFDAAIAAYDEAISRNPNHAYGHFGKGYSLCLIGRPGEAIEPLEQVLSLSPRDPQAWSVCVMLCFSLLLTDEPRKALERARQAQRLPNAPHWALAAEAAALTALGESEKAKVSLDAALAARPELDAAFLDRAFPFANEADYGKLASLMMGVFVPAKDTS